MDVSLEMNVEQTMRVSPTLIAVNQILALSSQELQTAIKQEAEENPALEISERQTCNMCGEVLRNGICPSCTRNGQAGQSSSNAIDETGQGFLPEPEYGGGAAYAPRGADDEFDPVSLVAAEPTMRERLMNDLRSPRHGRA